MKKIKCVIWDLDNTVWEGVLAEGDTLLVKDKSVKTIKELDRRGILQSIASKNDFDYAMQKLNDVGIADYFLCPQIHWEAKSTSIKKIVEKLNIGMDSVAFIDDQQFELDEVKYVNPDITCINADKISDILDMPCMVPKYITSDSAMRRKLYQIDFERKRAEESFQGPQDAFLKTLKMKFVIKLAKERDLVRAEELTERTHQLNSTGYTYSYSELKKMVESPDYIVLVADLQDKYGTYGTIGLVVIEMKNNEWVIKLLLMSCRTISRGAGSILLNYLIHYTYENNVQLRAEFVHNKRNRMMYITYKFLGFKLIQKLGDVEILVHEHSNIQDMPDYVEIEQTQGIFLL
mgnify:CR=1 FL=1